MPATRGESPRFPNPDTDTYTSLGGAEHVVAEAEAVHRRP